MEQIADSLGMNWIEGNTEWGTVKCPDGIICKSENERYTFTNVSGNTITTELGDIGIYTPFNDDYCGGAQECITKRCNTHIFCGGEISYVMALRMGGQGPHLGLVLTEGSLGGYSIERNTGASSNDRGDFIMHPSPVTLEPGNSFSVAWKFFWHDGKEDFYRKIKEIRSDFIDVHADNYVVFSGERIRITANGEEYVNEVSSLPGEKVFDIEVNGVKTFCRILVLPGLKDLADARVRYIAEKQQYPLKDDPRYGAYLPYDTEMNKFIYPDCDWAYDYNSGRERVGMGCLIARYCRLVHDQETEKSLEQYMEFVERELYDDKNTVVANDYGYNLNWHRLYNYPWMATFFLEYYELKNDVSYLRKAYRIMKAFYGLNGIKFYGINIPVIQLTEDLLNAGMNEEYNEIIYLFKAHAERMIENDVYYPKSEVNFEQSIVAPAADLLLQMYIVTGDTRYKDAGKRQMDVLELFNGLQPDYHLYEVAIRHWDGFWFGRRRQYGDTFPHYWSALTGNVYDLWFRISGDEAYKRKSEASHRGVMSMFFPDGRASCACVFPVTVNGEKGNGYDVAANDQDWGMFYYLLYGDVKLGK